MWVCCSKMKTFSPSLIISLRYSLIRGGRGRLWPPSLPGETAGERHALVRVFLSPSSPCWYLEPGHGDKGGCCGDQQTQPGALQLPSDPVPHTGCTRVALRALARGATGPWTPRNVKLLGHGRRGPPVETLTHRLPGESPKAQTHKPRLAQGPAPSTRPSAETYKHETHTGHEEARKHTESRAQHDLSPSSVYLMQHAFIERLLYAGSFCRRGITGPVKAGTTLWSPGGRL